MNALCKLDRVPKELRSLVRVRDLINYEGPILTEYRSPAGEPYLYFWCDVKPGSHHCWLAFRVSKRDLLKFLSGKLSLLRLIQQSQGERVYLLEIDGEIDYKTVYLLEKDDIPQNYLPGEDSVYDPDLSNATAVEGE